MSAVIKKYLKSPEKYYNDPNFRILISLKAYMRRVADNIRQTRIEGLCRIPNKKLLETPFHHSKIYTPRKYVVYLCSDDTSCCQSSEKTCVAKKSETIERVFQVQYVSNE